MASGGHVDRIAAEFGVDFIGATTKPTSRHQSRARRTCQKILQSHGAAHLRLVFGLINTKDNRGNWVAPCFKSVSRLLHNKPDLAKRPDFLTLFDQINLEALLNSAKETSPKAPTTAMTVLLSYEVERLITEQEKEQAA